MLLGATIVYGSQRLPYFLHSANVFFIGLNVGEVAIMALPLTLIVITGEIDLSVASMLGLSGVVMAELFTHGWPIWPAMAWPLVVGAVLRRVQRRAGHAARAAVARGHDRDADAVPRDRADHPAEGHDRRLPEPPYRRSASSRSAARRSRGRRLLRCARGDLRGRPARDAARARDLRDRRRPEAALFAGIRVKRIKFWLFVLSGLLSGFAGILWTLRFASARYDAGIGLELFVVTIVLLGGVSIFGGRGTIIGVVLAVARARRPCRRR